MCIVTLHIRREFPTFAVVWGERNHPDCNMLDTLKFGIPLTQNQFNRIRNLALADDRWQWIQLQPSSGEMRFLRVRGLLNLDRESFHRDVAWDIPDYYTPADTFLVMETSLPKLWYGHNISLLYDFTAALGLIKKRLDRQFKTRFPHPSGWRVRRADICYAWRAPTQVIAQKLVDSLKHLHYPRKKPAIYPTSIQFSARTYSLKFYLKATEFKTHDRKALLKSGESLERVDYLESIANGVLRVEATLRYQYLKSRGIKTVADLARPLVEFHWDEEFVRLNPHFFDENGKMLATMQAFAMGEVRRSGITIPTSLVGDVDSEWFDFEDGDTFINPMIGLTMNGEVFMSNGGGFAVKHNCNLTSILQYFIQKLVGENRGMDTVDQVQEKLLAKYKTNKAARLLGFWMYIQKFGTEKAKELYGRDSYYDAKSDLKAADVSLVEPPKLTLVDDEFLQNFKFDVPSPYAVNRVDDFRSSQNLLNLVRDSDI